MAPYSTLPKVMAKRKALHFIDNTSALAGLVKGYAKAADMGRVSNATWAILLGLETDPYFEYVRSKANIADLPSREQMLLTKQILIGMGWREEQITVVEAAFPPTDKWSCPTSDWVLRAREEAEADEQGQRQCRRRR